MNPTRSPEVLVVGGGPAGLATAIACAQRGLEVVVLERRSTFPIDKACGEGLMPDAVEHLAELGVRPPGCALTGIRYTDGERSVYGAFVEPRASTEPRVRRLDSVFPVSSEQPSGHLGRPSCSARLGLGVRRTDLSATLRRRAEEAGVSLIVGDRCRALRLRASPAFRNESQGRYEIVSESGTWSPQVLVGADGLLSQVRKQAGLEAPSNRDPSKERLGIRCHFRELREEPAWGNSSRPAQPTMTCVEVLWADGVEAYVTPVGEGVFGVAFLFSRAFSKRGGESGEGGPKRGSVFAQCVARFPELQERLQRCEAVSRTRGAGPLKRRARRHAVGNVALVGDAGGYLDAITGEGMAIAFAEARLLADRVAGTLCGSHHDAQIISALRRYHHDAARRRLVPETMTYGALVLSRRPWLRRRFLRALERQPAVFERVLALHTRASRDSAALPLAVELGWRLALG